MERLAEFFLGGNEAHDPAATPADLKELQRTTRLLRNELDRVIEDEVAANEAYEEATDNIRRLRAFAGDRRRERDTLRKLADDAENDCHAVHDACRCEEQKLKMINENISWLRDGASRAVVDAVEARNETQQLARALTTDVPETFFRFRADVQNLKTECEIGEILVREFSEQRKMLQQHLGDKAQQLDEIQSQVAKLSNELLVERTRQEMNQTRCQFLSDQLERMGGKVPGDNVLFSVQDLFTKMTKHQADPRTRRKSLLSQSVIVKPNSGQNCSPPSIHPLPSSLSVTNIHSLQQHTAKSSFLTDNVFHKLPQIYQMGNEIQPENNVYKIGHNHQGISICCKDDDETIISALTLEEMEFRSSNSVKSDKRR